MLNAAFAIVWKDVRAELRTRELVSAMGLFALLSVLVFSFALELSREAREAVVTGVLWVVVLFSSFLGLNRSMAGEREGGNFDGLLLAPIPRAALLFGKLIGNFVFTFVVAFTLMFIMTVLFNLTLLRPTLLVTVALGTLGLTTVGTLLATMTAQTRSRETLLPIVMLPVALPVLLGVVRGSSAALSDSADWASWVSLVVTVDFIYLVLGYLLFDFVVEE